MCVSACEMVILYMQTVWPLRRVSIGLSVPEVPHPNSGMCLHGCTAFTAYVCSSCSLAVHVHVYVDRCTCTGQSYWFSGRPE